MKKRHLTESEVTEALQMLNRHKLSISQVAKYFKVTKPTLLKSCRLWEVERKEASDGNFYTVRRGKMYFEINKLAEKESSL